MFRTRLRVPILWEKLHVVCLPLSYVRSADQWHIGEYTIYNLFTLKWLSKYHLCQSYYGTKQNKNEQSARFYLLQMCFSKEHVNNFNTFQITNKSQTLSLLLV